VAGNGGESGNGGGDAAADSDGRAGGDDPGVRADYLDKLRAHLARHKEYPRRARARGIEGEVRVAFTVHPDGRLTATRIQQGSDSRRLDRAAKRMLERAEPAPRFAPAMDQSPIKLELPVRFGME
jgi:protein TonB